MKDSPAPPVPLARLVGRYGAARRACRPKVGDKMFLHRHSYLEVIEITGIEPHAVEYKKDVYHDNGLSWEVWAPKWINLGSYQKRTIRSLRRGCHFLPANAGAVAPPPQMPDSTNDAPGG